jgi:hypothetical protein
MANKVKVVIAFDRDNSRIGKTIEVTEQEARILISEGRAAPAGTGKDAEALRKPAGPTTTPPGPQVIAADVTASAASEKAAK